MKRPTIERVANKDIKEKWKNFYLSFRESFAIGDKDSGNIVDKRYYQRKGIGSGKYWRKKAKANMPDKPSKQKDPFEEIRKIIKNGLDGGTLPNSRPVDADIPDVLQGFN